MKVEEYAIRLREEHQDVMAANGGMLPNEAFAQLIFDKLEDAGEITESDVCVYEADGMSVCGYGIEHEDDDEVRLDVFTQIHVNTDTPQMLTREDVTRALMHLRNFVRMALANRLVDIEESTTQFDMVEAIAATQKHLKRINLYVLCDALAPKDLPRNSRERLDGIDASVRIWDLERLCRFQSAGNHEAISVNVEAMVEKPIAILEMPTEGAEYECYLAIVPAQLLADIYEREGPRLLERNVRSFLKATGRINRGIQETIRSEPRMFLAYNNGISATAHGVETDRSSGALVIRRILDLQVVNGGQTTASLHWANYRKKLPLDGIFVQMKLSVLASSRYDDVVAKISRFANSQNRISDADFFANNSFHVELEHLSRRVRTPDGESYWFYERSRGQYQDEISRQVTPVRAKAWRKQHPASQRLTKVDVARLDNVWAGLPHLVSLGGEKNFRKWTEANKVEKPDEAWFRTLVARSIVLRKAADLVGDLDTIKGYRANVVVYTLAWILRKRPALIDLDAVWLQQKTAPAVDAAIESIALQLYEALIETAEGKNVTEWAKRAECWETLSVAEFDLEEADTGRTVHDDREAVVNALRDAPEGLMKGEIVEGTGLDASSVTHALRLLVKERELRTKGQRRGMRYLLVRKRGG